MSAINLFFYGFFLTLIYLDISILIYFPLSQKGDIISLLKQMLDCNTIEIFQVLNLAVTLL